MTCNIQEVAPKKAKLEIAEREFAATMAILEEKRAQVRLLEEKLMDLNAKLDAAQQRRKVLQDQVHYCEAKLFKAQKLIGNNKIMVFNAFSHFCSSTSTQITDT